VILISKEEGDKPLCLFLLTLLATCFEWSSDKGYISIVGDEDSENNRSCVNAWGKRKTSRKALLYWDVLLLVFYLVFMGWSLIQYDRDFVNLRPYVGWWYGQVAIGLTVFLIVSIALSVVVLIRIRTSKKAMRVLK